MDNETKHLLFPHARRSRCGGRPSWWGARAHPAAGLFDHARANIMRHIVSVDVGHSRLLWTMRLRICCFRMPAFLAVVLGLAGGELVHIQRLDSSTMHEQTS